MLVADFVLTSRKTLEPRPSKGENPRKNVAGSPTNVPGARTYRSRILPQVNAKARGSRGTCLFGSHSQVGFTWIWLDLLWQKNAFALNAPTSRPPRDRCSSMASFSDPPFASWSLFRRSVRSEFRLSGPTSSPIPGANFGPHAEITPSPGQPGPLAFTSYIHRSDLLGFGRIYSGHKKSLSPPQHSRLPIEPPASDVARALFPCCHLERSGEARAESKDLRGGG